MANVDPEAKALYKIGLHSCEDEAFSATHIQHYTEFSLLDNTAVKIKATDTMYNLPEDACRTIEHSVDYEVSGGE